MTQRASDLLGEVADRLAEAATESGIVAAEAIPAIEPERLAGYKDGSIDELARRGRTLLPAHIASAVGRALDVNESAEVGLRETLKVLGLHAGAVWVREGARRKLAKTIGMQQGEEEEFSQTGGDGPSRVVETSSGPAESRVDRIAGEWSAIRAELRTKGVLLGAMTVATRLPRTFASSDLGFVAAVAA